jgi:predicted XRE-type DNA-binding protein
MRSHPKKGEYVHRMVAEVYCEGYDPKLTVNHIDLDKTNNHADNLEWVTMGENSRSGKITKHSAKYEKIKLMHQSGMTQVAIGEALGLRQGYISKVVNGVFYGC